MPPPGVAARRAGTNKPESTTTTLRASSSISARMEAPFPVIKESSTTISSSARRARRRQSSASTAATVPPPSSSISSQQQLSRRQTSSQQQDNSELLRRQQVRKQSEPGTTQADALMHGRVRAVQRAAVAIQKHRALAKELGRAPSPSEWGEALGGVTEESLRVVLEQGTVARAALVKGWDGLVAKFVGKFAMRLSDSELQDLVVEGQLGVVEAAVRFEGGQGAGFKTYVYYWVRKRVMDAAAMYDRSTFTGLHEQRQASHIWKVVEAHEKESGGNVMSKEEIAAKVGLPVARVEELGRKGQRYGLIGASGREGVMAVDTAQEQGGGQGGVLESMYLAEVEEAIRGALAALPREERTVLSLRLGLEDGQPKGWEEIVRTMEGCSLSYLRKVESKAKIMLRRNVDVVKLIHRRPASFDEVLFAGGE
ncbi:rna polymerase sigma factor [Nannochloropsis oceanica]